MVAATLTDQHDATVDALQGRVRQDFIKRCGDLQAEAAVTWIARIGTIECSIETAISVEPDDADVVAIGQRAGGGQHNPAVSSDHHFDAAQEAGRVDDETINHALARHRAGRIEAGIHAAIRVESCHARVGAAVDAAPGHHDLAITLQGDAVTLVAARRCRHPAMPVPLAKAAIAGVANHDDNTTKKSTNQRRFRTLFILCFLCVGRFTASSCKTDMQTSMSFASVGSPGCVRRRAPLS